MHSLRLGVGGGPGITSSKDTGKDRRECKGLLSPFTVSRTDFKTSHLIPAPHPSTPTPPQALALLGLSHGLKLMQVFVCFSTFVFYLSFLLEPFLAKRNLDVALNPRLKSLYSKALNSPGIGGARL